MKQYLKAEFELFKKQKSMIIIGICMLFVLMLLLLFSGIGNAQYCASVMVIGYITYLFISLAFFLSPASYWQNRKKIVVTTEQLVLALGESKRTYVKNKIFFCVVLYFGMVLFIALMQIPATLIAGETYSLWSFGLEVLVLTAVVFLSFFVFFVIPIRWYVLAIPGWCGFCGGFVGGYFSVLSELTKEQAFDVFFAKALFGIAVGILSVLYRWFRTLAEERCGLRVKKQISEEV